MNEFDEKLLRLKQALKLTQDKDVAAALGLSKQAFSQRRARGSFPDSEVFALSARSPDRRIDAHHIVTGVHAVTSGVNSEEQDQLTTALDICWNLPEELRAKWLADGRALELQALRRGDARHVRRKEIEGPQPSVHEEPAAQVFHGPVGQAGAGDIVNHAPVTIRQKAK